MLSVIYHWGALHMGSAGYQRVSGGELQRGCVGVHYRGFLLRNL